MRGKDQQHELFSYGSLEQRVPADHPLRPIRVMVDDALKEMSARFDDIYGEEGRKSPPEFLGRPSRNCPRSNVQIPAKAGWCVRELKANLPVWAMLYQAQNLDLDTGNVRVPVFIETNHHSPYRVPERNREPRKPNLRCYSNCLHNLRRYV